MSTSLDDVHADVPACSGAGCELQQVRGGLPVAMCRDESSVRTSIPGYGIPVEPQVHRDQQRELRRPVPPVDLIGLNAAEDEFRHPLIALHTISHDEVTAGSGGPSEAHSSRKCPSALTADLTARSRVGETGPLEVGGVECGETGDRDGESWVSARGDCGPLEHAATRSIEALSAALVVLEYRVIARIILLSSSVRRGRAWKGCDAVSNVRTYGQLRSRNCDQTRVRAPNDSRRKRHWQPVCAMCSTASTTVRRSVECLRPRWSGALNTGSSSAYCSSVRSLG